MNKLTNPSILLTALILSLPASWAQSNPSNEAGAEVVQGSRGFLSIDYQGNKFVVPFRAIISLSRHEFLVDGGGKVKEVTIDTQGSVVARFYYLDTILSDSALNAGQIIDNRIKKIVGKAEEKTGANSRTVVKHYPQTTHAKTVEFNLSNETQLNRIFDHVRVEWVVNNGRGDGKTLVIR